jgi:hypothetical protein
MGGWEGCVAFGGIWTLYLGSNLEGFYIHLRVPSCISFDQFFRMNLISWFPGVVTFGVPFPFDEDLEGPRPSVALMIDNALHFIFFFPINQVRWGPGEVWTVGGHFMIGR